MKKMFLICVLSLICLSFLASCVYIPEPAITGDVKDKAGDASGIDVAIDNTIDNTLNEPDNTNVNAVTPPTVAEPSAKDLIADIGAVEKASDEYTNTAEDFANALMNKDADTIASFTGGKAKDYAFLDKVEITSVKVYPFELSADKQQNINNNNQYWISSYNYVVELDVASSLYDGFKTGKNFYHLGIVPYSAAGYEVNNFVPFENVEDFCIQNINEDFTEYFISEFCSLYAHKLSEGRNFAENFNFGESEHMITHLMANSGVFSPYPPYSLYEINEFIDEVFDGNDGFEKETFDKERWQYYGANDELDNDGRFYGCSYAHGGTTAEYEVIDIHKSGDDNVTYIVQMYSDYAHFSKAYKVKLDFEMERGELPCLEVVEIRDVVTRNVAYISL